jgi:glycosyltransferase involved in cell wall biosynthesis
MNVLFISPWYPNKFDKMVGLFVQKHAEAVSFYCNTKVLSVQPSELVNNIEIERKSDLGFEEIIVYYPGKSDNIFHKFNKHINFCLAYIHGFKVLRDSNFEIDIIHSNILTRNVLIAYLIKLIYQKPYVITEHWSRYLPEQNSYNGIFRKWVTKIVSRNANAVLPVSGKLKNAMISHGIINSNYITINNIVDDYFFEKSIDKSRNKKRILSVSCFDERAKNIKGIIRVANEVLKNRNDVEFIFIGTGKDFEDVVNYSTEITKGNTNISFIGEKTPLEVAKWMRESDIFVLFSNFETAGIVITESLVSGTPIISTDVGIASEFINDSNGKIIQVGNEQQFIVELNHMLDNLQSYDRSTISANSLNLFDKRFIGKKITEIYHNSINLH